MRLSFVVPAYNEECYLGDCLRSILVQTRDLAVGIAASLRRKLAADSLRWAAE